MNAAKTAERRKNVTPGADTCVADVTHATMAVAMLQEYTTTYTTISV